jgi:hypothetical protein
LKWGKGNIRGWTGLGEIPKMGRNKGEKARNSEGPNSLHLSTEEEEEEKEKGRRRGGKKMKHQKWGERDEKSNDPERRSG